MRRLRPSSSSDVPELKVQVEVNQGKNYAGKIGMSTQVLFLLGADGRIVEGTSTGNLAEHFSTAGHQARPRCKGVPRDAGQRGQDRVGSSLACRLRSSTPSATSPGGQGRAGPPDTAAALAELHVVEVKLDAGCRWWCSPTTLDPAPGGRAMGCTSTRARLHHHGLVGALVVPGRAPSSAIRPERQRRPDHLVGGACRRWVGAAQGWRDRRPVP